MPPIHRSEGTTASERFLAKIAEESFLNLWTYANVFRDQRINGSDKGDGKELCDLLVVCGDDVIIFSDKEVGWCDQKPSDVAWCRWFKAAIERSADQLHGAERWLREFPDRIFLDKACTTPLPIDLPPVERRRVHLVVIAIGANDAAKAFGGHQYGVLSIDASIQGRVHRDKDAAGFKPFAIGDIDPSRPFVHVFDQIAMDLTLQLQSTITDFTEYLARRATNIRMQRIGEALGEDDLLGFYISRTRPNGEHDFIRHNGEEIRDGQLLRVENHFFQSVLRDPGFNRKLDADKISYLWDNLITIFTDRLLDGTSISTKGGSVEVREAEFVLQTMAREKRLDRRAYSIAIEGAIKAMIASKQPRFARFLLPHETSTNQTVAYVYLMMDYPDWVDPDTPDGENEYRNLRRTTLTIYCLSILMEHSSLESCIGIAMNAPPECSGRAGGSEDIMLVNQAMLTAELREKVLKNRQIFNIMTNYKSTTSATLFSVDEFPDN
jgi:hypothetical protein